MQRCHDFGGQKLGSSLYNNNILVYFALFQLKMNRKHPNNAVNARKSRCPPYYLELEFTDRAHLLGILLLEDLRKSQEGDLQNSNFEGGT